MKRLASTLAVFGLALGCSNTHQTRPDGAAGAGIAGARAGTGGAGTAGAGTAGADASDASAADATAGDGGATTTQGPDAGDTSDATDSSTATLPDFTDGTRLKALAYVTDQGDRLWHGWHDTQRQEDCTFRLASDGKVRCLPAVEGTGFFFDAACTKPLLFRTPCLGAPPPYVAARDATACGGAAASLHKRLDKIPTPAVVHYVDDTGACVFTDNLEANVDYWVAAVAAEPDTAFVSADEIRDGRGAALMVRYYRGDDGALQLLGPYDRGRGHACAEPAQLPGVCAPDPLTTVTTPGPLTTGEFLDAACSVRTVVAFSTCEVPGTHPELVFSSLGGKACLGQQTGRFNRLGAPDPNRPFLKSGASCAQSTSNRVGVASDHRFVLGDEVPASSFPAVRTVDEGTGRLRVRTLVTPDGQHLSRTRIFDSVQGGTCTPTLVGATLRCVPDAFAEGLYGDAACTQHVYVQNDTSCATPKFVTVSDPVACDAPAALKLPHYLEVGPVLTPTPAMLFLKVNASECVAYPLLGEAHEATERPLSDAPAILGG